MKPGRVYYNENDKHMANWIHALIQVGALPHGEVDTRSVVDVSADDVRGFDQCHWFAGIGGWPHALALAGWPADRQCWTGSCPCQPFSVAGRGAGTDDPRHLWPAWFSLVEQCRPPVVLGEQVASRDGLYWLDLVLADMERINYAIGRVVLPAACVGAPHGRHRIYFVADDDRARRQQQPPTRLHADGPSGDDAARRGTVGDVADTEASDRRGEQSASREERRGTGPTGTSTAGDMADPERPQRGPDVEPGDDECDGTDERWTQAHGLLGTRRTLRDMGDTDTPRSQGRGLLDADQRTLDPDQRATRSAGVADFWGDAEWIPCVDGRARPTEPGTFPLADGVPARVVKLRGYGNAIVAPLAAAFVKAYMELDR